MPNCLGVYVGKSIIKYAKVSRDKNSSLFKVLSYGVKFYENLEETVKAIINETNSTADELCMNVSRESFAEFNVFNKLKTKDIKELLKTEFETYCAERGVVSSALDMRYILVKNTVNTDSYKAICVSVNKAELSRTWQMLENEKLKSLSSIAFSITNIMKDKGLAEQAAIVNIEDETTVTVITKGEISKVATVSIGMDDVLSRLTDRLNSYSKAYEACKSVTINFGEADSFSEEQRQAMEFILPTMYDLRERVKNILEEFGSEIRKIYITGIGAIINNIDLYFADAFDSQTCEVLKPFFISKESNNLKDIIEVNSAVGLAMNGLGFFEKHLDFLHSDELGTIALKKKIEKVFSQDGVQATKKWFSDFTDNLKEKLKSKKKAKEEIDAGHARPNIEFDDDVGSGQIINADFDDEPDEKGASSALDAFDKWLIRLAATLGIAFIAYCGLSYYTESVIQAKIKEADDNIAAANANIDKVDNDIDYVSTQALEYKSKTDKLERLISKIRIMAERSFNIPNFMSQLMFIVPEDVRVTSLQITTDKKVIINAQSGKYAQLGYFVSRLKLENALKNVNMEVLSMESDIKIKISGELP